MAWLNLVFIYIILKSIGSVFRRLLLRRENSADPNITAVAFNFAAGIILLIYVAVVGFETFNVTTIWIWILLNILGAVLGDILQFNAFKRIGIGDFTLVDSTRAIWTVIAATIFLSESLTLAQILGAVLIIGANYLVFWPQRTKHPSKRGLLLAAGFAFVFGLATVNDRILFPEVDVISYLSIAFLVQGFVLGIIYRRKLPRTKELLTKENLMPFVGDVSFFVPSIVVLLEAIKRTDNVSLLSAWLPLNIIVTVLLGAVFLKERKYLHLKALGSLLATTGAVILAVS